MSFNHGGNDANHPSHKFLHCNAQNLAGLTSPSDDQQLLMQHRFTEQHTEEQQRLLQIQQLVAANSNQLILEQQNMQSALDFLDRHRQRQIQIQIDRDIQIQNQMLMIEQQIQRQSGVITPTMQQQNLLLSPTLLRHRRLQQLEFLAAQEELEVDTLQNALQTEEILESCHFSPSTEDMIDYQFYHNLPRKTYSNLSTVELASSLPSIHTSPHSTPSAAVGVIVGTGGEQDRSNEASTEAHIEGRVGDMDQRISLELQQIMMEPPTKYEYLMESSAEEHYCHMLHEDSLTQAMKLQSKEENSTKKSEGQWLTSHVDSCKDNIPIEQINEETKQQNAISLLKVNDASKEKDRTQRKKKGIAALVEALLKSPSETNHLLVESSSANGCGLSPIAAAAQPENGTPLHLDHPEAAEIFQLMQRLKEDDGIGVSPGDYAYDYADASEQSEEDSEVGRDILEGQNEQDSIEYQNLSNDLSSKAEEKIMRPSHDKPMAPLLLSHDDYWWPSPTSIEKMRASDGQMKEKLPYSAKRLKSDSKQRGVLQKLPHCRIHVKQQQLEGISPQRAPLCTQVVEEHPTDPLVCCSVCYTWRHAACGGHHSWSSSQRTVNPKTQFIPLCDLCFKEIDAVSNDEEMSKSLQRQRVLHLRKTLLTSQVVRYAAFSKHAHRSFKWPLGSALSTHMPGHIRSVNARHEKAEMLWQEMAVKLNNPMLRSRDRVKVRHRVFEKLQQFIEEAGKSDVARDVPLGYEVERRNFFDPLDDPIVEDKMGKGEEQVNKCQSTAAPHIDEQSKQLTESSSLCSTSLPEIPCVRGTSFHQGINLDGSAAPQIINSNGEVIVSPNTNEKIRNEKIRDGSICAAADQIVENRSQDIGDHSSFRSPAVACARASCGRVPRYDSLFCSDACGVSQLERDLLDALEYSEEVHPSQLR